jgi:hypothetical protein
MNTSSQEMPSGKGMARAVSVAGLALVWGLIWANMPSKDEWLSDQVKPGFTVPATIPELDLTIPGVPVPPAANPPAQIPTRSAGVSSGDRTGSSCVKGQGLNATPRCNRFVPHSSRESLRDRASQHVSKS